LTFAVGLSLLVLCAAFPVPAYSESESSLRERIERGEERERHLTSAIAGLDRLLV
jgi:hypothetical protein